MLEMVERGVERRLGRARSIDVDVFDAVGGADLDLRRVRLQRIERMGNRRHERIQQYRETRDPDMQALAFCPISHGRQYSKDVSYYSTRPRFIPASMKNISGIFLPLHRLYVLRVATARRRYPQDRIPSCHRPE